MGTLEDAVFILFMVVIGIVGAAFSAVFCTVTGVIGSVCYFAKLTAKIWKKEVKK